MKLTAKKSGFAILLAASLLTAAFAAEPDGKSKPVMPKAKDHPLMEIWSGYHYQSEETRKQQDDDAANPGMDYYKTGEKLWTEVSGTKKKSCDSCHGKAANSMRRAAARFPVYYPLSKKPLNIEGRINMCREKFMGAEIWAPDSKELLAMTTFVKHQALDVRVTPQVDGAMAEFFDKGKKFYTTRRGQLDLSCSHCHDKHAGKKLREATLSQGQSNGYPTYRKTEGKTVSLLQQVNACLARVRSVPLNPESDDFLNLEVYLAWRGQGLVVETPSVRD